MSTPSTQRKQVFSGIQPTGSLHLGRYFGAVQNWVKLQQSYDCIYCIVDYHAMTMPFDPQTLRAQAWNVAFDLIAVGLDPDNLFIQSMIPEHTELAWIFNCVSSYGEVSRMTQFKDKSQQINEKDKDTFISTGLFTYPVLQAADILLYNADFVPVGKDQGQHLELTRNIAQRFNQVVGRKYFVMPETLYTDLPKVLSTADPLKKMSASLGPKHYINVFSAPDVIRKQIKSAVTDSGDTPQGEISPGVENLFAMINAAGGHPDANQLKEDAKNGTLQYGRLKDLAGKILVELTEPFRQNRLEIEAHQISYRNRIFASADVIRKQAQSTIHEVKELIGLTNIRT